MNNGLIWLGIGSKCVLSARSRTIMFLKKQEIAWPSERPSTYQGLIFGDNKVTTCWKQTPAFLSYGRLQSQSEDHVAVPGLPVCTPQWIPAVCRWTHLHNSLSSWQTTVARSVWRHLTVTRFRENLMSQDILHDVCNLLLTRDNYGQPVSEFRFNRCYIHRSNICVTVWRKSLTVGWVCTCIAHRSVRILKLDYYRHCTGTSLNRLFLQQGIETSYGNFPRTITCYIFDAI